MMAAMNNRTEVLKQLVKMDNSPLDFKQMKVRQMDTFFGVHYPWDNVYVKIP